jgi:YHS domain-containing protein
MIRLLSLVLSACTLSGVSQAQQSAAPAATAPAKQEAAPSWQAQTICPVSKEALDEGRSHFVDFEGQRIFVCCKKCVKKAAAAPEQMLATLAKGGMAAQSSNALCPVSGEKLDDRENLVWVGNKSFAVCCKKCARKASNTPAAYLDKLEGRGKQTLCPISGEKIDPEVSVEVDGYRIGACCEKCAAKIKANPQAAFAKLAAKKVVLEPIAKTCALNPKEKRDVQQFITVGAKRSYFCCAKCKGKYLAKLQAAKQEQTKTKAKLEALGYLGDGSESTRRK